MTGARRRDSDRGVDAVRRLLAKRRLAVLIGAAALLMKLLIPAGYMIDDSHGRLTIALCSGTTAGAVTMAMPGMDHATPAHGKSTGHGKAELPCAFSGLSAAALGAIDPVQIAALIAFVMAAGPTDVASPVSIASAYLRPPLRGPPADR